MTVLKVNNPVNNSFNGLMNDLFNDFPVYGKPLKTYNDTTAVNIQENATSYQLQVLAPGFEKNDFAIKIEGYLLTIEVLAKETTMDETVKQIRTEFNIKSFKRSFSLDEKIETENIGATYENGILNLLLPKKEVAKAIQKQIAIK